nr:ribonuclease H-like domain-containing protein [Tanacetum cinerariifolium]
QTPGSGISILLAVGTPSTGSGKLYCQWELSSSKFSSYPSSSSQLFKNLRILVKMADFVDGSIDWDKQTEEGNTEPRSLENFGMIARIKIESDVDSKGEVVSANDVIPVGVSISAGNVAAIVVRLQSETEFALMGLSTEVSIPVTCPLCYDSKYKLIEKDYQGQREQLNDCVVDLKAHKNDVKILEKQIKCHQKNQLAYEEKIKVLSYTLEENSMSVRTKRGLGLDKYIGEGELGIDDSKVSIFDSNNDELEGRPIYNRFALVDHIKAVSPPLIGNYMPPSNIPDIDESQMVYGKKATDSSEIKTNDDSISHSNDSVLFYFSDRCLEPSTNNLQMCDSSVECSRPNHSDHHSTDSISSVFAPASESRDTIVIDCDRQEDFPSICSIETDVKSSKTLCNKFGSFNKESHFRSAKPGFLLDSKTQFLLVNKTQFLLAKDRGIVDSGCSRCMSRNKDKLEDFKDFDGGEVTFGGSTGKISRKGTIKTKNLNFENVLYVEELQHFNLISVSQICDQTHRVLFTENECFDVTGFGYLVVNIVSACLVCWTNLLQGNIWFLFTFACRVTFCWLFPIPAGDLVSAGHMLFLLDTTPYPAPLVTKKIFANKRKYQGPDMPLVAHMLHPGEPAFEQAQQQDVSQPPPSHVVAPHPSLDPMPSPPRPSLPPPIPFGLAPTSGVVSTEPILDILFSSRPSEPVLETITSPFRDNDTGGGSFHESLPRPHPATPTISLTRIATLEAKLKATKNLHRDTVVLFAKRIKKLESKLKTKKMELVLSDSENEEEAWQSKKLDALLDLANAALHELSLSTTLSKPANPEQSSKQEISPTTLDAVLTLSQSKARARAATIIYKRLKKQKSSASEASVLIIELLDSPPKDTSLPLDPETEEQDAPLRKSSRKKSIAKKRTLPSPSKPKFDAFLFDEDDPKAAFKRYLRHASDDDEPAEPISLALGSDITTWELILTEFGRGKIHVITRADGTVKRFSTLRELLYWAGRADLMVLYGLVSNKYKTERATCIGLGLWMVLRTLIAARKERDAFIIWNHQDQWQIQSWRFYAIPTIHVLEAEARDIMYMFMDKKYPLTPDTLQRMLNHGLEINRDPSGNDLTTAIQLIQSLLNQLNLAA